jgi:hypothetical protein
VELLVRAGCDTAVGAAAASTGAQLAAKFRHAGVVERLKRLSLEGDTRPAGAKKKRKKRKKRKKTVQLCLQAGGQGPVDLVALEVEPALGDEPDGGLGPEPAAEPAAAAAEVAAAAAEVVRLVAVAAVVEPAAEPASQGIRDSPAAVAAVASIMAAAAELQLRSCSCGGSCGSCVSAAAVVEPEAALSFVSDVVAEAAAAEPAAAAAETEEDTAIEPAGFPRLEDAVVVTAAVDAAAAVAEDQGGAAEAAANAAVHIPHSSEFLLNELVARVIAPGGETFQTDVQGLTSVLTPGPDILPNAAALVAAEVTEDQDQEELGADQPTESAADASVADVAEVADPSAASATYRPNWSEGRVERTVPRSRSPPRHRLREADAEAEPGREPTLGVEPTAPMAAFDEAAVQAWLAAVPGLAAAARAGAPEAAGGGGGQRGWGVDPLGGLAGPSLGFPAVP